MLFYGCTHSSSLHHLNLSCSINTCVTDELAARRCLGHNEWMNGRSVECSLHEHQDVAALCPDGGYLWLRGCSWTAGDVSRQWTVGQLEDKGRPWTYPRSNNKSLLCLVHPPPQPNVPNSRTTSAGHRGENSQPGAFAVK